MNHHPSVAMKLYPTLFAMLAISASLPATPPLPTADSLNSGLRLYYDTTAESYQLHWWGMDEHFYFVEQSTDLVNWSFVPIFEAGTADVLHYGFATNAERLFFRLRYTDDPDSSLMQSDLDGDGLSVYQEYLIGSDPFNPDTSGDGIFDGIALKLGLPVIHPEEPSPDPLDSTPPSIQLTAPASAVMLP